MHFNEEAVMISCFDAHCDTIYRCMETGETSALEYGANREEQRRYYSVFFDEMGSSINFAYYCLTISKEYSLFGNKMIAYGKYYF